MVPGEYFLEQVPVAANAGRPATKILVKSTGDRPIQVGSHFHFFEVNRALQFDRVAAYGMRLNIAAGTAVRFEPGEEKMVELTSFAGAREIHGGNGLLGGRLDADEIRTRALQRLEKFRNAHGKDTTR